MHLLLVCARNVPGSSLPCSHTAFLSAFQNQDAQCPCAHEKCCRDRDGKGKKTQVVAWRKDKGSDVGEAVAQKQKQEEASNRTEDRATEIQGDQDKNPKQ